MCRYLNKLLLFVIIVSVSSCNTDPLKVDLSQNMAHVNLHRSEKLIFNSTDSLRSFGEFLPIYGQFVVGFGHPDEIGFAVELNRFSKDTNVRSLYRKSEDLFEDSEQLQRDFNQAFSYYEYHFPNQVTPQIVTNISGLNYAIFLGDTTIGIGLDMFLGKDFETYSRVATIHAYMTGTMTPSHVVSKSMYSWIQGRFEENTEYSNMLEQIVFHGKILYTMDALLYGEPDSIKCGFSEAQLNWCRRNEFNIWSALINKNILYTTDHMSINKWIEPAPFTSGLPKESPGQLGRWVGWQMVRAFMKRHPETTLPHLFNKHGAQQILNLSKYKPK